MIGNMKFETLGDGVPNVPRVKRIWGFLGGVAGGLLSLLGQNRQSGFTKEQQRLQSKLNREEMTYSSSLQRGQQDYMMNTMYGKTASGMKNAGLNPAGDAGGVAGMSTPGVNPSSGASGPSAGMPDVAGSAASLANVAADINLKKSQAGLADAQADDQRFKNSPIYRSLILKGMDQSIALDVSRVAVNNSNINLNTQKVAESITQQQKMLSEIDVNDEQKKVLAQSCVESQFKCASYLQGMKESNQRICLMKAQAYAQTEIAKLQKHLAHQADTQASLNTSLGTKADAETALTHQITQTEEYRTEEQKGKAKGSKLDNKAKELANVAVAYANEVLMAMPPEERAKYEDRKSVV